MSTFTDVAKAGLQAHLENKLITEIDEDDVARADVVKVGPLQGEPELEDAPLSVEIYTNDPEKPDEWHDEIVEWQMPRTAVWSRKFTVFYRVQLAETGESLAEAEAIASTLRSRIEVALNMMDWGSLPIDGESIEACPLDDMLSMQAQGGGPNEYDYSGKIRFSILTFTAYR
jgi:hypothetical protein